MVKTEDKIKIDKIKLKGYDNFIMLSDLHIGYHSGNAGWINNMRDYFMNFFIPYLNQKANEKSIMICLGDVFDDRKRVDNAANNLAIDVFEMIAKILPVYIINGNHDLYNESDIGVTSLRSLDNIPNVNIIREATELTIDTGAKKKRKLMLIPYQGSFERSTKLLNENGNDDFIFMHDDIKALRYDNGREITVGVDTAAVTGKLYAGHIHTRQESPRVTYIGNPYSTRRSDIGNIKGIYQVNIDTGTEEFTENTYSPIFQKIWLHDILDLDYESVLKIFANNYSDIRYNNLEKPHVNITQIVEAIKPCKPKHVEFKLENDGESYEDYNETDNSVTVAELTVDNVVNALIDRLEISDDKKGQLVLLNKKYYDLASNAD